MAEQSLYRRHRPQSFADVVGQEHVVRTLSNAIERDRVHHAYLFVGSRGTGKTSMAKILARSLNCEQGPTLTPCGVCPPCRAIADGSSMDVIEMDAASNRSVDHIRELRERVGYAAAEGRWKVYILDEAHMLTREAWNAFLKTLEEPPPSTVFVLATTEAHKVMPTIIDRCQRFDFGRPPPEQIAVVLRRVAEAEGLTLADGAVAAIARAANGSFRDALGTLDQLVAYSGNEIATEDVLAVLGVADQRLVRDAAQAIGAGDGKAALGVSAALARSGHDPSRFALDLVEHLRRLLVISTLGEVPEHFLIDPGDEETMRTQATSLGDAAILRGIDELSAAVTAIREGDEARMTVELALLRAARPDLDPSRAAILQRLERLERGGSSHRGVAPPPRAAATEPPRATEAAPPARSAPAPAADDSAAVPPPEPPPAPEPEPGPPASAPEPAGDPPPVTPPRVNPPEAGADDPARPSVPPPAPASAEPAPEPVPSPADEVPEPAPATTTAGAAPPPGDAQPAAPGVDRVAELWPVVLEELKQDGAGMLAAVLGAARPSAGEEGESLVLGFPPDMTFNRRKAEVKESREQIRAAVQRVFERPLQVEFATLTEEESGAGDAAPLDEGELFERIAQEFDAEVVIEDEPKEETS